MKKITTLILASVFASNSMAEGYQVNMQSTRQTGMGHVGAALKLGAESMHFNPAGMAFLDKSIDISAGASAIFSKASFKNNGTGLTERTDNNPSTPIYAYAGFKVYDFMTAGISFTTPYGSGLNWGKNWSGAHLVQDISLRAYMIQPTFAFKILPNLSIGAGLEIAFGKVELSRALMPVGSLSSIPNIGTFLPNYQAYNDIAPISATLQGKSKTGIGFNVGLLYDINEQWSVGVSYRSEVKLKVKSGTADLQFGSDEIKQAVETINRIIVGAGGSPIIPPLSEGTFRAEMPLPANLNIGVAWKPNPRLTLSAEAQIVFWKSYKDLTIHFNESALKIEDIYAPKNYKNVAAYRLGAEYALTNRFDIRGGLYYDQSPIQKDYYNPETPGMDKIGLSAGFSFRPIKSLSVDFAFLYIQGLGRDGAYTDPRTGLKFEGHYKTHAFAPSLGLTYRY